MQNPVDLVGKRFGRLTVLRERPEPYFVPSDGKRIRVWECVCDCGNHVNVLQNALLSKSRGTKSCGCLRSEKTRSAMKDLTGRRFGHLVVVRQAPLPAAEANGIKTGWLCKCDCGNEIVKSAKQLQSGKVQSCGCLRQASSGKRARDFNPCVPFSGTSIKNISPSRKINRNNKSGVRGVYFSEKKQMYVAKIGIKNKQITIGYFHNLEDAKKARVAAEEAVFAPIIDEYNENKEDSI